MGYNFVPSLPHWSIEIPCSDGTEGENLKPKSVVVKLPSGKLVTPLTRSTASSSPRRRGRKEYERDTGSLTIGLGPQKQKARTYPDVEESDPPAVIPAAVAEVLNLSLGQNEEGGRIRIRIKEEGCRRRKTTVTWAIMKMSKMVMQRVGNDTRLELNAVCAIKLIHFCEETVDGGVDSVIAVQFGRIFDPSRRTRALERAIRSLKTPTSYSSA